MALRITKYIVILINIKLYTRTNTHARARFKNRIDFRLKCIKTFSFINKKRRLWACSTSGTRERRGSQTHWRCHSSSLRLLKCTPVNSRTTRSFNILSNRSLEPTKEKKNEFYQSESPILFFGARRRCDFRFVGATFEKYFGQWRIFQSRRAQIEIFATSFATTTLLQSLCCDCKSRSDATFSQLNCKELSKWIRLPITSFLPLVRSVQQVAHSRPSFPLLILSSTHFFQGSRCACFEKCELMKINGVLFVFFFFTQSLHHNLCLIVFTQVPLQENLT